MISKVRTIFLAFISSIFLIAASQSLCSANNIFLAERALALHDPYLSCRLLFSQEQKGKNICNGDNINSDIIPKFIQNKSFIELRLLGISLRELGLTQSSFKVFDIARSKLSNIQDADKLQLSLANTYFELFLLNKKRVFNTIVISEGFQNSRELFNLATSTNKLYKDIWFSKDSEIKLLSKINWLLFISNLGTASNELSSLLESEKPFIHQCILEISAELKNSYKQEQRLKFIEAIVNLNQLDLHFDEVFFGQTKIIIDKGFERNDYKSLSTVFAEIAEFYSQIHDLQGSLKYFQRSLYYASAINNLDLKLLANWKIGDIFFQNRDFEIALKYYTQAYINAKTVRSKLLKVGVNKQLYFLDVLQPLYLQYLETLFQQSTPDLRDIINISQDLKLAELENYLKCGQITLKQNVLDLSHARSPDAILFIIERYNSYALIIRDIDGKLSYVSLDKELVNIELYKAYHLIENFGNSYHSEEVIKQVFGSLYTSIFKPVLPLLPDSGTIIFNVDKKFAKIPWSMLFDGHKFLIEKYSIGNLLATDQLYTEVIYSKPKVLAAGVSKKITGHFPEIPGVLRELDFIKQVLPTRTLIDEDFVVEKFFNYAAKYPFIHLATHGNFSSNPEDTYLIAWDKKLQFQDIKRLVQSRSNLPLDLLALSACESAKGDQRSILGLAGIAYYSGARTSISSLWLVDDDSQAIIMSKFYQYIDSGKTKVESLRLAQLYLLNKSDFHSPFYWGSVVLLGSWL